MWYLVLNCHPLLRQTGSGRFGGSSLDVAGYPRQGFHSRTATRQLRKERWVVKGN